VGNVSCRFVKTSAITKLGLLVLLAAIREREAVGHVQALANVQAEQLARRQVGQRLTAVLDNLEHGLVHTKKKKKRSMSGARGA